MKQLNVIAFGRGLFASIKRQPCLTKAHQKAKYPLIGSCFDTFDSIFLKKFQRGHFLMKRPIPGRFIFLKQVLCMYTRTVINSISNADISKKHENTFFVIKLKIFCKCFLACHSISEIKSNLCTNLRKMVGFDAKITFCYFCIPGER